MQLFFDFFKKIYIVPYNHKTVADSLVILSKSLEKIGNLGVLSWNLWITRFGDYADDMRDGKDITAKHQPYLSTVADSPVPPRQFSCRPQAISL